MKPDHVSIVEHVTFKDEQFMDAFNRLGKYLKEMQSKGMFPMDYGDNNAIRCSYCDETQLWYISIQTDYMNGMTIKKVEKLKGKK